jgi:hypothetical protein
MGESQKIMSAFSKRHNIVLTFFLLTLHVHILKTRRNDCCLYMFAGITSEKDSIETMLYEIK